MDSGGQGLPRHDIAVSDRSVAGDVDYADWSTPQLIARIRQLEESLRSKDAIGQPVLPPTAAGHESNNTANKSTAAAADALAEPPADQAARRKKKEPRVFDFSKHSCRPIALKVAYLGWSYHGLASQEADTVPTVEAVLFDALIRARLIPNRRDCHWSRCGRTDKGVSSFEQVFGLHIRSALPIGAKGTAADWPLDGGIPYVSILNRLLPPDVRVLAWSPAPPSFDARFDCTHRRYRYFFPAEGLDVERMRDAARRYVGAHDFRFFCKIDASKPNLKYERTILSADVHTPLAAPLVPDAFLVFEVAGHAFLWHQVRCMVAILFLVGRGLEAPDVVDHLLDTTRHPPGAGRPLYRMAPELPLVLVECGYPEGLLQFR
ncbi:pseudouridine synthase, partial [Zopfochytrium polystomum]